MPRGDFTPEIRTAMATGQPKKVNVTPPRENLADMKRDAAGGIKEGSSQDQRLDAMPANQAGPRRPPQMQTAPAGNLPPDLHHVGAATSIAHAILNRRPGGM
jgi:hypothetical protein